MMTEPRIFVFVHPAYADMICYPQTLNVWESFERCGAIVRYGPDIRTIDPQPGDKLVGYGRMDAYRDIADAFPRHDKWHYVVDESSQATAPYERAHSYMQQMNFGNVIVTYQNRAHLERLTSLGYRYVIMPQTFPEIRPKQQKTGGILLSGQISDGLYPVRTRAWRAISASMRKDQFTALGTPGQDISTRTHNTIREEYYKLLDGFRMGIVCRAGSRDRFVAKYIEMGACWCLPVGDCPTYMPDDMKRAMVNVENMSGAQIVAEVTRLLSDPFELQNRTDVYVAGVARHYMATPNMERVLREIRQIPQS